MGSEIDFDGASQPHRRPGRPAKSDSLADDTRSTIVAAAAAEFSREGYEATSMRGIARAANVDPALVRHYFSDKSDLFGEALAGSLEADHMVRQALAGPHDQIGVNLVRFVVEALDRPATGMRVVRLMHTALGQEFAASMLRQFIIRDGLKHIARELGETDAELRASFAATQIVGLIVARYGLKIEPLASASVDDVVSRIGPAVQWHLMGKPLP